MSSNGTSRGESRKSGSSDKSTSDAVRRSSEMAAKMKAALASGKKSLVDQQKNSKSREELEENLKNKEIVYEARMKIHERIKEMGMQVHQPASKPGDKFKDSALRPEEASAFALLHMEKVQRLNEVKSRASKGLTNLNLKMPSLVLDAISSDKLQSKGKWGETPVQQKKPAQTARQVKKEELEFEEKPPLSPIGLQKVKEEEPDSSTAPVVEFLDPRLYLKPALRKRRHFDFKQPGEYEKMAKMQRSKAKLERLQSEIEKAAKQTGISSAVKLAIVTPTGLPETSTGEYIPEVEWWDEVVLGNGKKYEDIPSLKDLAPLERYADTVTDLVEHPIQLKPPDEPLQPQYLKASLTKKERKKLRRQNRREVMKEKTEKIRLGLDKPPEPKLKISNLMRVLGTDAIQDPTKMEAVVRKQMAERAQKHVEENKNRKLTREEKTSKAIRKVAEDTSLAVHVTVFKIKSLANQSKKFKVSMNAKQLQMTGVIILLDDINVVIMEGGPKQQKFYRNLMLNRIKWSEEIAGQKHVRKGAAAAANVKQEEGGGNAQQPQGERNECTLVWEGVVQKRAFIGEPRFIQAVNHKQARELLDKHGIAHYWDLCYATSVLLSEEK